MDVKRNKVGNEVFSEEDKRIAQMLADPDFDDTAKDRHIRAECDWIQSQWSRCERSARNCFPTSSVEASPVHFSGTHNGITMVR